MWGGDGYQDTKGVPRDVSAEGGCEWGTERSSMSYIHVETLLTDGGEDIYMHMYSPCILCSRYSGDCHSPLHTQTRIRVTILSPVLYEYRDEDARSAAMVATGWLAVARLVICIHLRPSPFPFPLTASTLIA